MTSAVPLSFSLIRITRGNKEENRDLSKWEWNSDAALVTNNEHRREYVRGHTYSTPKD